MCAESISTGFETESSRPGNKSFNIVSTLCVVADSHSVCSSGEQRQSHINAFLMSLSAVCLRKSYTGCLDTGCPTAAHIRRGQQTIGLLWLCNSIRVWGRVGIGTYNLGHNLNPTSYMNQPVIQPNKTRVVINLEHVFYLVKKREVN